MSFCLSVNHDLELRCVICTGVTLFAPVLHLNCTALSQSESSNFFMYIIKSIIPIYYIDTGVLLKNIPLIKFIKTTSGTRVVYFP